MTGDHHRYLVLHGLRLKGFADVDSVADLVGLEPANVEQALEGAASDGLVKYRDGKIAGWMPTPEGRTLHSQLIARELEASNAREEVDECYRRFLDLNDDLKRVCTDWQLRDGELNDHADATYDRTVVDRLLGVHLEVEPVTRELASALARFSPYTARLARAARRVDAGQHEWFTGVTIDSYHTVWFQLHEDLLVTLGIDRMEGST